MGERSRPRNGAGLSAPAIVAIVGIRSTSDASASVSAGRGNRTGFEITIGMWIVSS